MTPRHSRTLRYADLQSGHANPGSSESDLVSGKMKEAVIYTIVIHYVTPRSQGYGDVMATYIRRVKTPSCIR